MGKTKKRKKPIADNVTRKKKEVKATNPFEVKMNRQKHNVLGRKRTKYDKGMPGVSRSKAIERRNKTLLVEYRKRDKTNRLIDRRFGEQDAEMSVEEKMLQRFAMERQHRPEKSSVFQLNDEEAEDELTHFGQSLSEIEKFEAPEASDSEDDAEEKKQMAKMVSEEHFGGFLTRKNDDESKTSGKPKSWKERMEEIIAQSKKHKYERQTEKEKTQALTEQLDREWKDLRLVVGACKRSKDANDTSGATTKVDSYDIMVRELQFEQKGQPSDRLKTEEESAKEEKERLETLEADRVRRMKGLSAEDEKLGQRSAHRSADEIDESFDFDATKKKKNFQLSYKDGAMVVPDEVEAMLVGEEKIEEQEDAEINDENSEQDTVAGNGNEEDEEDSDSEDAMDRTSDLESDEDHDDDDNEDDVEDVESNVKRVRFRDDVQPKSAEDIKAMLMKKKEIMDSAREEIPYTFQAPDSLDDLVALLADRSDDDQLLVIHRLRKCHHPSLAEGNKEKLETLFVLLLQYFGSVARDPARLSLADRLVRPIYELMRPSADAAVQASLSAVIAMRDEFNQARPRSPQFPDVDVLMLLKLLSILFPTSDFRHPVITPAMLFMGQILAQCPVKSPKDFASGLFVCQLFLEYVSLSRRFVPETINFLSGAIFLAIPATETTRPKACIDTVIAPFKSSAKGVSLVLTSGSDFSKMTMEPVNFGRLFASDRAPADARELDRIRLQLLWQSLSLVQLFIELYAELPAFAEIFAPIKSRCMQLGSVAGHPAEIQALRNSIVERTSEVCAQPRRQKVAVKKEKPAMLKMYEPQVEDSFDGHKKYGEKSLTEKQKLVHKYRRELKGAVREIRRDGAFIARHEIKEQIDRDADRKRKVKAIYAMLANQEGEHNALQRKRDRLK